MTSHPHRARGGAILILIAGLCALLASMSLAFLVRMRADAEESRSVVRDAQARIMMVAGCDYILEAGRLGWEPPPSADPLAPRDPGREAFGWVDVRDGLPGPKTTALSPVSGTPYKVGELYGSRIVKPSTTGVPEPAEVNSANFPIGTHGRFPMWVWARTRYATRLTMTYNPIATDPGSADFGLPLLRHPDPQPVVANGWPNAVSDARFSGTSSAQEYFCQGDPTPRASSTGLAWFRVFRRSADQFVITCGAGASLGFADWQDVQREELAGITPAATAIFGDRDTFNALRDQEVRFWYLVEWSPAVGGATYQCIDNEQSPDHYQWRPMNPMHENYGGAGHQSQTYVRNMLGTMRFIQRLSGEPDAGTW